MGEVLRLPGDGRDDGWGGVADRGDRDPGAEVDERVAVDVLDHAAAGALDVDRQARGDAGGDGRRTTCGQGDRPRSGYRRHDLPALRQVCGDQGGQHGFLRHGATVVRNALDVETSATVFVAM
ncbi:hypothetical protein GALL_418380 [mine drainage metagenome]|uniref:Uncharacterized protein n=1 Tax=mine drainage metagenome TaxID=410659 RepID=A0A1J5PYC2_9ZZZZ